MTASDDYCELCDLPRSQCVHGQPPHPPSQPAKKAPPPPRKRPATRARSTSRPETAVSRRWTPPEAFKPLIVSVLERNGGELEAEEVFAELEVLAADRLLPEDSQRTPEGELRWHYAARRARMALIGEGRMTKARPGVWQLAGPGRQPR
jgi:hypothetical protein